MKLVTFEISTPVDSIRRIGAMLDAEKIIDLKVGYASFLKESGTETRIEEESSLRLPPDMIEFFKGGELSKKSAQQTIDYAIDSLKKNGELKGIWVSYNGRG